MCTPILPSMYDGSRVVHLLMLADKAISIAALMTMNDAILKMDGEK